MTMINSDLVLKALSDYSNDLQKKVSHGMCRDYQSYQNYVGKIQGAEYAMSKIAEFTGGEDDE